MRVVDQMSTSRDDNQLAFLVVEDVVVLRDASQLTGSVTIDLGGTADQARVTSPLFDRTNLYAFSQELRTGLRNAEQAYIEDPEAQA